jgi:hypothetical protein
MTATWRVPSSVRHAPAHGTPSHMELPSWFQSLVCLSSSEIPSSEIRSRNCRRPNCCRKMDSIGCQEKLGLAHDEETQKGNAKQKGECHAR